MQKKWYEKFPHPVFMLFCIICIAGLLTYLLPAGSYERTLINGRQRVIPASFAFIQNTPLGLMDIFVAMSIGFKEASDIIFVVLISGVMFGILQKTEMIENLVAALIQKLGHQNRFLIIGISTIFFGILGVLVGYENNIALIPIAALLSLAIGGDLILAAGMAVGGITVGFGLSPINPYTVGIGHQIAEMPMFSGSLLRSLLCFMALMALAWYNIRYMKKIEAFPEASLGKGLDTSIFKMAKSIDQYTIQPKHWLILSIFIGGLAVMLYGVFVHHWYLKEIAAVFTIISLIVGIAARIGVQEFCDSSLKSIALVAPGAFMVGFARTVGVILEQGHVQDTVAYFFANALTDLPLMFSGTLMIFAQASLNMIIPSGSGQALATLPIMIPIGEIIGLTRQTTILAFQIGDGVTNLFNPTLGGLIAMLSLCQVPFDRWLRFIFPITLVILALSIVFLLFSIFIHWGPA